ncbi:MAG: ricin-type beta-trefoil lectin domain protein [Cyanobacteria bacterium P01_A01_bin.116]
MAVVNFYNHGSYELVLRRRSDKSEYRINRGEGISTPLEDISPGDIFDVENVTNPDILYRPIFIVDETTTDVQIRGNTPFRDQKLSFTDIRNIDFESSLYGIDLTEFNPRRVVNAFSPRPIFEGLNPDSIDYEYQGGKLVKTGMTYSATNLSQGSSDAKMAYSYSSFSKDWNINLGGSKTVPINKTGGTLKGSLDFGYNQFETEERSSTNVYAYTREQKSVYEVGMNPKVGYLDTAFIIAVKQINSVQDALMNIIPAYGTHYPTKVYYGGERSAYVSMSSSTYAKAKGFGVNIKGKLSASQKALKGGKPKGKSSKVASGSLGFGYSESQEERELFKNTKSGYQSMGGVGSFDDWSVSEDNAVAVAVVLGPLYDLIEPSIFKDGTSRELLAQKKEFIRQAIDEHLAQMKTLGEPLPAPRLYSVTLNRLQVTQALDDFERRTSGHVHASVNPVQAGFNPTLWYIPSASLDFQYRKGNFVTPNVKRDLVQLPSTAGSFEPLQLSILGDIAEKDHFSGSEHHRGHSNPLTLNTLGVGEQQKIEFDCRAFTTHADKGTIRVTATVRREPSDFIESVLPFESEKTPLLSASQALKILHQAHPNFCLNLHGNDAKNGGVINLWSVNGHESQRWEMRDDGTIRHQAHPNFCLNLHDNNAVNGGVINLWSVNGHESQRWEMRGDGTIRHQAHPNFCLNLHGNNAANGGVINLWSVNGHESQRWQSQGELSPG